MPEHQLRGEGARAAGAAADTGEPVAQQHQLGGGAAAAAAGAEAEQQQQPVAAAPGHQQQQEENQQMQQQEVPKEVQDAAAAGPKDQQLQGAGQVGAPDVQEDNLFDMQEVRGVRRAVRDPCVHVLEGRGWSFLEGELAACRRPEQVAGGLARKPCKFAPERALLPWPRRTTHAQQQPQQPR